MSELSVGSLSGLAANSYVIDVASGSTLDLSNGATLPAGSILQVVSTTKTDTFSTSSTSFVDVTGLSVSLTPTSTTSKVYVVVTMVASNSGDSADEYQLVRDSTAIGNSTAGSSFNGFYVANTYRFGTTGDNPVPFSFNFLDSPATTSATTYKVQVATDANTAFVNRIGNNTNIGTSSTITAMEVAG